MATPCPPGHRPIQNPPKCYIFSNPSHLKAKPAETVAFRGAVRAELVPENDLMLAYDEIITFRAPECILTWPRMRRVAQPKPPNGMNGHAFDRCSIVLPFSAVGRTHLGNLGEYLSELE